MRDPGDSRGAEAQDNADSEPPERLHLEFVHYDGDWRLFEPISPAIEAAGRVLGDLVAPSGPDAFAAVALSSDRHVQTLNRAYRGKDKPTNVLAFPALAVSAEREGTTRRFLGDIVLAAETVAREAAEQNKPPRHHLQHLVVHGVLHLHGYDHECADEAREMEALESEVLALLGIANPYAEPDPSATE